MRYLCCKKLLFLGAIASLLSVLSACGSLSQPTENKAETTPHVAIPETIEPDPLKAHAGDHEHQVYKLQSEVITTLNKFVGVEEEIIKDYFVWINNAKDVLGIKVSEEEKSTIDKVSEQVLEKTKILQTGLGVIGFGARIASYFGVPGAALVADLSSFEEVISSARGVIKAVQPKNVQEKFSMMQDFVGGLKKNIFGLSEKEVNQAVETLNSLIKTLDQSFTISNKIVANNDVVFAVLKEVNKKKELNISFLQAFWQRSVAENLAYLDMLYQMGHALFTTASEIAQTLQSYQKYDSVVKALAQFTQTESKMGDIKGAVEHTTAQVRDYKAIEN